MKLKHSIAKTNFFRHGIGDPMGSYATMVDKFEQGQRANFTQCIHMFGDIVLELFRKFCVVLDSTSFWSMEVKMHNSSIESGHSSLFLCQQLTEEIKAGYTYIMEDPLETPVLVSMPLTNVSPRLNVWSNFSLKENAENDTIMLMERNLHDHGYDLNSQQQSMVHVTESRFFIWLWSHVKMKWNAGYVHNITLSSTLVLSKRYVALERPWDPGIVIMYKSVVPACFKARGSQCRSGRYKVLRPEQAIAWGQAMFFGGGNVTPVDVTALGLALAVMGCGPGGLGLGLAVETIKEAAPPLVWLFPSPLGSPLDHLLVQVRWLHFVSTSPPILTGGQGV
jgi:hypothetical protein